MEQQQQRYPQMALMDTDEKQGRGSLSAEICGICG